MALDSEVAKQVLTELKSYARVVLPTLLVFSIESRAHLKAWHAVRQLPFLEKEPSKKDIESSANPTETEIAELRLQHKAAKKIYGQKWFSRLILALMLMCIAVFDQFISLEDRVGYLDDTSSGTDTDIQRTHNWYYDSALGQIDLVKLYYPVTLFLPAVLLIARVLFLFSEDRVVLRNSKGAPFMVSVKNERCALRRPVLCISIASILLAIGALVYQSRVCSMILFASIVHFLVSDAVPTKTSLKQFVFAATFLLVVTGVFVWLWIDSFSLPIRMFQLQPQLHDGETIWSEFIWSAMFSSGLFGCMSFFYRMDHSFARPEERLVSSPDTDIPVRVSSNGESVHATLRGTRIPFRPHRRAPTISLPDDPAASGNRCPRFRRCNRWARPYFRTAVLSWMPVYTFIAYLKVKGYIETDAELAGIYALYFVPFVTCLAVILRAAAKGRDELKRVWDYKEDWISKEGLEVDAGADVAHNCDADTEIEGKVLISEKN